MAINALRFSGDPIGRVRADMAEYWKAASGGAVLGNVMRAARNLILRRNMDLRDPAINGYFLGLNRGRQGAALLRSFTQTHLWYLWMGGQRFEDRNLSPVVLNPRYLYSRTSGGTYYRGGVDEVGDTVILPKLTYIPYGGVDQRSLILPRPPYLMGGLLEVPYTVTSIHSFEISPLAFLDRFSLWFAMMLE